MRLLQNNRRFRIFFLLTLLCLLPGLFLNACGEPPGWPCEANAGPSPIPSLAARGNSIYLLSHGGAALTALQANDGALQWRASVPSPGSWSVENDRISFYSPTDPASISVFRASDGALQWKASVPFASSWSVENDRVYLDALNSISVLRASDGKTLWSKHIDTSLGQGLYVTQGLVYQIQNGVFTALNPSNGAASWSMRLSSLSALHIVDGIVYLLTQQNQLLAMREDTGAELWQVNLGQWDLSRTFIDSGTFLRVQQGVVYLSANQVYALRASDGHMLWHSSLDIVSNGPLAGVFKPLLFSVTTDMVYILFKASIYALRAADGRQVWQNGNGHIVGGPGLPEHLPILDLSGTFYVTELDRTSGSINLVALRPGDGKVLWQYSLGLFRVIHAWANQGSRLYVLVASGSFSDANAILVALQEQNGKTLWQRPVHATALLLAGNALYAGIAGNSFSPCAPKSKDQITSFEADDGVQLWHQQLPVLQPPS